MPEIVATAFSAEVTGTVKSVSQKSPPSASPQSSRPTK